MCGEKGFVGVTGITDATKESFINSNGEITSYTVEVLTPCAAHCCLLFNEAQGTIEKYFFKNAPQIKNIGTACLWCGVTQYCEALEEVAEILPYGIKDTKLEQLLALIWRIKSTK